MRSGSFAAAVIALLLPVAASAQVLEGLGNIGGNTVSITMSPQYPVSHGRATLSFTSNYINLAAATLHVTVNGKQVYTGPVHSVPVEIGNAGSVTSVQVAITAPGTTFNRTLQIQPQDVVLIAEPIASTPPLYPGKASVPLQGNVRVVAVANLKGTSGKASNPTSYSYSWKIDDTTMTDSSGVGRSSIIVISPLKYRDRIVSVTVRDASGSLVGGDSVTLSALDPTMRVYENDPLLGIRYDHALLGAYTIPGAETTLYAAPFSLPVSSGAPLVRWFLNGTAAQTGNSITLRPSGSGRGTASLSLTATGDSATSVASSLSLIFGASSGTNFFGL